jgi:hypothetical protein
MPPAPPTPGIVAVPTACFLIDMISGYNRLVCSRTFESVRLIHNFSMEPTSSLARIRMKTLFLLAHVNRLFSVCGTRFELLQKSSLQRGGCRSGGP